MIRTIMAESWTEGDEREEQESNENYGEIPKTPPHRKGTGTGTVLANRAVQSNVCGYPKSTLTEKPDAKFLCSSGGNLLKLPVQSSCGHRYCKSCLQVLLKTADPVCQACVAEGDAGNITDKEGCGFPDMAIRREMKVLDARCPNDRCNWKGKFSGYPAHEASCNFRQVKCDVCNAWVSHNLLKEHKNPDTGDCPGAKCPFNCDANNTTSHQAENVAHHTLVLLKKINGLKSEISDGSSKSLPDMMRRMEEIEDRMKRLTTDSEGSGVTDVGFRKLQEKSAINESIMAVLNRQVEKLIVEQNEMEHQRSPSNSLLERLQGQMSSLERSLALKEIELAEKTLRIEALESTTYNGEYIWKISDFTRKRQNAINGRTVSIFSAPFYTSKSGYKVCTRIYLNGDGMGRGTHLSLFFVVMRGQYDAILTWPFPYRVTFTLLSQTGSDHIVDGFRPDPSSSSFRRPTSDMNIASGMPNFCTISRLEETNSPYMKNDTLFIKIKILCDD